MSRQFQHWVEEYQDQAWSLARYLLKDAAEAWLVTPVAVEVRGGGGGKE